MMNLCMRRTSRCFGVIFWDKSIWKIDCVQLIFSLNSKLGWVLLLTFLHWTVLIAVDDWGLGGGLIPAWSNYEPPSYHKIHLHPTEILWIRCTAYKGFREWRDREQIPNSGRQLPTIPVLLTERPPSCSIYMTHSFCCVGILVWLIARLANRKVMYSGEKCERWRREWGNCAR